MMMGRGDRVGATGWVGYTLRDWIQTLVFKED